MAVLTMTHSYTDSIFANLHMHSSTTVGNKKFTTHNQRCE